MKRFLLAATLVLLGVFRLEAARPSVTWTINSAEVRGQDDHLVVFIDWSVSEGLLGSRSGLIIVPSLEGPMNEVELAPICIYGATAYVNEPRASGNYREIAYIKKRQKLDISYHDAVKMEDWMDSLRLKVTTYNWSEIFGSSLISTSRYWLFTKPVMPEFPVFQWAPLEPPKETEPKKVSIEAPILFHDGLTKYDPHYGDNEENMARFLAKVKYISSSKTVRLKSSRLGVYISPKGTSAESMKVSKHCATSVFNYLQKAGAFGLVTPTRFGGGEDWEYVREWVSQNAYGQDRRIQEIFSWGSGDDAIAGALRSERPGVWRDLELNCFPYAGKAVYEVEVYPFSFKSSWFVEPVYDQVPELLSAWDFYYLASGYDYGSEKWADAILTGARYCLTSAELNMDIVMYFCQQQRLHAAVPFMRNMGNCDKARYVKSVWLFRSGRYAEALEGFKYLAHKDAYYAGLLSHVEPYLAALSGQGLWQKSDPIL